MVFGPCLNSGLLGALRNHDNLVTRLKVLMDNHKYLDPTKYA